ncbi:MAG TPA: GAF domain-containing SpoIIE family protein phosphatase [Candidatus Babeliales bacterium]|jgi:sigma-B regulation protein RsbU (phosphoserine phosphatase)|nr:GAF domain-containing SpoIIE family protein phosphatase [Candidatus Babeliales bacterium]
MWPSLLLGLLVASLAGWGITAYVQSRRIRRLERSHEEIQVEETLVFDFLHGLGEAFRGTIRPYELHRLIVEGAVRILDAHGGALYVTDRTGGKLTPAFISKGCPPLVDVPQHILQQAAANPVALESFLRLHTVSANEGLIGRVWQTGQAVSLNEFSEAPELAKLRSSAFGSVSLMGTALQYGNQNLGVLTVANGPQGTPFSQADFVVFKSIAEQSAFALYNAIIYSMANEKKRLDHDLEIARDIQRILLPSEAPAINGFQISGINVPARQVSGDYFDYIHVDQERLGVAIADVSGKGVPASLIMAICRSVLRAEAAGNPSPADVLRKVNRQLYPDIKEDMFISMAYLVLDHQRDGITLARAGHDAPLWYQRQSQSVTPVKSPGMVVGIDSGSVFDRLTTDFSIPLERNDCLVLYTDGVTETLNSEGDEYGVDRMMQSVRASANDGAQAIVKRIIEDVREFTGSVPQNDDITVIAIRKT